MGDLFFVLRVTFITVVVVVIMQVKVGEETLEERARRWAANAPLVEVLQEVADGAVLLVAEGYQHVTASMTDRFHDKVSKEDQPGFRTMKLHLNRRGEQVRARAEGVIDSLKKNEGEPTSSSTK